VRLARGGPHGSKHVLRFFPLHTNRIARRLA
jgi:hypothetical protein